MVVEEEVAVDEEGKRSHITVTAFLLLLVLLLLLPDNKELSWQIEIKIEAAHQLFHTWCHHVSPFW